MDYKKNPWPMMLSFVFICLSLNNHLSLGADTISTNQSLSGDRTIISNGGNFELGFFTPGKSSRSNYYIGMWYKKVSLKTIVWVANRETPVSDRSSSVLRISDGNLVLFNESQIPIWSTNLSSTSSGPLKAVLQDDGNFVLKDGSDNSSKLLWQSFDNPTHTWLPGAKMAYNNKTKQNMHLISWKNSEDPAPGLFALELQQNTSSYIILWNKSVPYWKSGPWDGKAFSWVTEMRTNYIYNFSYVTNENESYFTYSLYDPSIISRLVMDTLGQIQQLAWLESTEQWNLFWSQPRTQCEVYSFCGRFGLCNQQSSPFCSCLKGFQATSSKSWNLSDFSAGCARKTGVCGNDSLANGKRDKFWEMPNMKFPSYSQPVSGQNSSECELICLNDCSCTAYAIDGGCSIWFGDLLNLQQFTSDDSSGRTLYLKLAASELPSSRNKSTVKRNCEPCGTNVIPYPLSSSSDCGDPMYLSFDCKTTSGQISFKTPSGTYRVTIIDPNTRKFFIQVKAGESLQLNQSLPFHLTSPRNSSTEVSSQVTDNVEIIWEPPLEPLCNVSADCMDWPHSTCKSGNDGKRCLCTISFLWDGTRLNCTKVYPPSKKRMTLLLIIGITSVVVLCAIISMCIWQRKMSKSKGNRQINQRNRAHRMLHSESHAQELIDLGELKEEDEKGVDLPLYDLESIRVATGNFSDENKLGQGGYGPVYKWLHVPGICDRWNLLNQIRCF